MRALKVSVSSFMMKNRCTITDARPIDEIGPLDIKIQPLLWLYLVFGLHLEVPWRG